MNVTKPWSVATNIRREHTLDDFNQDYEFEKLASVGVPLTYL
jgi:hypothetical protein